jgi:signal peptidase I
MTSSLKLTYMGPSMNPTLKVGDILKVVPYQSSKIRIGDIVVFCPAGEKQQVVHRVVSIVFRGGVKTRGDNNLNIDPDVLTADGIIGRVVSLERGKKVISVCGGNWGYLNAALLWAAKRINLVISKALHPAYHRLARAGIFRNILSPWVKPSILCFKRPAGTEMQLVIGRWVIGRRPAGQNRWRIRRPFRLLVDEALLTDENSIQLHS